MVDYNVSKSIFLEVFSTEFPVIYELGLFWASVGPKLPIWPKRGHVMFQILKRLLKADPEI